MQAIKSFFFFFFLPAIWWPRWHKWMASVHFSLNKEPHWKYCHYFVLPRWQPLLRGGELKGLGQPTFFQVLLSGKFSAIANICQSNALARCWGSCNCWGCENLLAPWPGGTWSCVCPGVLAVSWVEFYSGKVSRKEASVDIVVVSPGRGWDTSPGWYEGKFPLTIVPSLHPPAPLWSSAAGFPKELNAQELSFHQLK